MLLFYEMQNFSLKQNKCLRSVKKYAKKRFQNQGEQETMETDERKGQKRFQYGLL